MIVTCEHRKKTRRRRTKRRGGYHTEDQNGKWEREAVPVGGVRGGTDHSSKRLKNVE